MKRAPIIPRVKVQETHSEKDSSAAPMVDALISRVGALTKGNSLLLSIDGRDVKFVLESVPAKKIETATRVWEGNERDQGLLCETSLDDLIPSFLTSRQQNPALGRKVGDVIEVADGSRRRMAAIVTGTDFLVLVGALDDSQMESITRLGNDYRPTSSYERGKRYARLLSEKYNGNVSALSQAENISRMSILRCMNTAKLPIEIISLFTHPGELSARAGEQLAALYEKEEALLLENAKKLHERKSMGEQLESDNIVAVLKTRNVNQEKEVVTAMKRQYASGASARYKGNKVFFSLDRSRVPADVVSRIEEILQELENTTS
ncbi:ParB/RepB/Spo0J family plasmid partition protein [Escherichia coli]|nr:ParB/RepB/Spo0J family plasmid partition protein [Escherichia coli]EFB1451874.1 ParB/RepB/Spo0J family plasmid partition protein [Escherichia coli]EFO2135482.1 ParB/RepB/Spo0J family plasmid partition protein [Escherichia coli]